MSEEVPLSEVNFSELVENLDKVTIDRDMDDPNPVYGLIGAAFYHGYKLTRTPQKITLHQESGPVIDKPDNSKKTGDPE